MKRGVYVSLIIVVLIFISIGSEYKCKSKDIDYKKYIRELISEYNSDNYVILEKIEDELKNKDSSVEEVGVNLLAREYFYSLSEQYDKLMEELYSTEKYLVTNNMYEELLALYSIVMGKYDKVEEFNSAYIYAYKAEKTASYIYEKSRNNEDLCNLISLKYIKAVIALEIGMENEADEAFNEAEELRKSFKIDNDQVYYYILYYYKGKGNYEEVKKYANKIIELRNKEGWTYTYNKEWYTKVSIILASSYLKDGEIDKCIEIVNELNQEGRNATFHSKKYEIYNLYADICNYYGNIDEAREWLIKAYNEIKDTNLNKKKLTTVKKIIDLLYDENKEETLRWYELYKEIVVELDELIETQFFIQQIVDTDLKNAEYDIKILKYQSEVLVGAVALTSITIFIISLLVIVENKRKKLLKDNIRILEHQMIIQHNYYEEIKAHQDETRRIRHDIKNHLNIIDRLIIDKEYESAKNYVENINKKTAEDYGVRVTNNKIIDAILFNKREICQQKKIKFDLDIRLPEKIGIDDFDICVLYGNLLDNAIEACEKIDINGQDRYIKIKSIIKGRSLFINIKNSNSGEVYKDGSRFLTSKKDKINHGIGITNVKRTIEKYNGSMKIDYSDKYFNVSIIVNI